MYTENLNTLYSSKLTLLILNNFSIRAVFFKLIWSRLTKIIISPHGPLRMWFYFIASQKQPDVSNFLQLTFVANGKYKSDKTNVFLASTWKKRCRTRWLDYVQKGLQYLYCENWRGVAVDRNQWKRLIV